MPAGFYYLENISEFPQKLISQKTGKIKKIANHDGDIEIGGGWVLLLTGVILTNKHIISDQI